MRLLSVNVSQPKAVPFGGKIITTGIFKQPVEGRKVKDRVLKRIFVIQLRPNGARSSTKSAA